jgi:hypothetical protein
VAETKGILVAGVDLFPQPHIDSAQLTDSTIVRNAKKGYKGESFIQFSFSSMLRAFVVAKEFLLGPTFAHVWGGWEVYVDYPFYFRNLLLSPALHSPTDDTFPPTPARGWFRRCRL